MGFSHHIVQYHIHIQIQYREGRIIILENFKSKHLNISRRNVYKSTIKGGKIGPQFFFLLYDVFNNRYFKLILFTDKIIDRYIFK